jgi:hypothetical protein
LSTRKSSCLAARKTSAEDPARFELRPALCFSLGRPGLVLFIPFPFKARVNGTVDGFVDGSSQILR